jgi:alkylated DNA repair dioxygenase AlkB
MIQSSLFECSLQTIADDASGPIIYRPDVISKEQAAQWFSSIHEQTDWHASMRMMYERMVGVPRLYAHYAIGDPAMPDLLLNALKVATSHVDAPFNSIGLNLYRDEHDSVAPHNDKLHELTPHQPIVLLSLGATRTMTIRQKQPPQLRTDIELEAGSLLLMGWNAQLHYDHGIPKCRQPTGPRISLAFRVRPRARSGLWGTAAKVSSS